MFIKCKSLRYPKSFHQSKARTVSKTKGLIMVTHKSLPCPFLILWRYMNKIGDGFIPQFLSNLDSDFIAQMGPDQSNNLICNVVLVTIG